MNKILKRIFKKILEKALLISRVRRGLDEVCRFYATTPIVKEPDRMNFTHYLPDTEERIKRLRRLINKRPVVILLHGASIRQLEQRITELKNCDICYFGLNICWPVEKYILKKISRRLSVVMKSGDPGGDMDNIIDFLERPGDNIFISEKQSFQEKKIPEGFNLDKFIKKYDKKLLFFTSTFTYITMEAGLSLRIPSMEYPLDFPRQDSFSILLSLAVIGGASLVVIFGGDGGRVNTEELYFRETGPSNPDSIVERTAEKLMIGTKLFNVAMPLMLEKIYKIYNLKPVDIINCSEQSHYTPLKKLSYDETIALLKSL